MTIQPIPSKTEPHKDRILIGIGCAMAAFFLLTVMSVAAKLLSETYHVIEIAFFRNLIAAIPFVAYVLFSDKKNLLKVGKPKALIFRVCFGTLGMVITFAAIKALPIAETTVLLFTSSLMLPAMAFFFLKEKVGPYRWSAIIIGMLGVIVMAQPSASTTLIGVTLALCAAFTHSVIQLMLRYLKTESPFTITFYFMTGGTLICAVLYPFFFTKIPDQSHMLLFLITGASGALGQLLLSNAYKYAPPAVVAPINYISLIWATGFDILIWSYIPGWPIFLGAAIIISSNLFILWRENLIKNKTREEILK